MLTELFLTGLAVTFFKGVTLLVSYVNNNAFPKPLNEDEERACLQILTGYKEQETLTTEEELMMEKARNTLIEHNLRLVAHLVKKYDSTGQDSEDMISIGTIGLIKGINTFNTDKKTRLATYAARCIENAILSIWLFWGSRTEKRYLLRKNGAYFAT